MPLVIEPDPERRGGYVLRAECVVPRPVDEVFAFFSDATKLETLTPAKLRFQILTPTPIEMFAGQIIDYRLKVRGIPMRWTSEISVWEPPRRFVDVQRRGPYSHWHHEHLFEPDGDNSTRVIDIVHYSVPGGALVNWLIVERDVKKIFAYRQQVLQEIFGPTSSSPATSPAAACQ